MTAKIQGEGDYESARDYNEETRRFVEQQKKEGKPMKGSAEDAKDELTREEREALSRARSGEQDKRDAEVLKEMEKKRQR